MILYGELQGGLQDGGVVRLYGLGPLPHFIYTPSSPQTTRYVAWSKSPYQCCNVEYVLGAEQYHFCRWVRMAEGTQGVLKPFL